MQSDCSLTVMNMEYVCNEGIRFRENEEKVVNEVEIEADKEAGVAEHDDDETEEG